MIDGCECVGLLRFGIMPMVATPLAVVIAYDPFPLLDINQGILVAVRHVRRFWNLSKLQLDHSPVSEAQSGMADQDSLHRGDDITPIG
jgi:hypothetical protein